MTLSFWACPTAAVNSDVLSKAVASGGSGFWILSASTLSTPMRLTFTKDGTTDGIAVFNGCFAVNEWHFYTLTWNGGTDFNGSDVKLYVDTREFPITAGASTDLVAAISDAGQVLGIGGNAFTSTYKGGLDQVRIYNRVLSRAEIYRIYANGWTQVSASNIGYTFTTQTLDALFDWNNGVNGAIPTAAGVSSGMLGSGLTTFSISPSPLVQISYNNTATLLRSLFNPMVVNSVTYPSFTAPSFVLDINHALGTAGSESVLANITTPANIVTARITWMSTLPKSDGGSYDLIWISNVGGTETSVIQLIPSSGIHVHVTFGGTRLGNNVEYYPNVWYECSLVWSAGSDAKCYVYSSVRPTDDYDRLSEQIPSTLGMPMFLVGVSTVTGMNNSQAATISFGDNHHGAHPSGHTYIAHIAFDLDGSTLPILP